MTTLAALAFAMSACEAAGASGTPTPVPSPSVSPTAHALITGGAARAPYIKQMRTDGRKVLGAYPPMGASCGLHIDIACLGRLMDVETLILALNEDNSKYTVPTELQDPDGRIRHFLTISIRGVRNAIDGVIEQNNAQVQSGIAQAQSVVDELAAALTRLEAMAA